MNMKKNVRNWFVVSICLLTIVAAANAKTIYVDADRPPGGGGINWADAYNYLQDALADADASAKPVEIRVARGAYKPDEGAGVVDADRTETFQLINSVTLKGGFAGDGEADPNARDVDIYETILSGDLDGNDVPVATSDLLTEPTRAENSYHVVTGDYTDSTAIIDGFTVTAGNANAALWSYDDIGGGMRNGIATFSSPTILNCTFADNSAIRSGGGMCNRRSNSILDNCTFLNNRANSEGGGMFSINNGPTLTNCTFIGNSAGNRAGGLEVQRSDSMISNCTFINNSSDARGGGMAISFCVPTLVNCEFIGNSASTNGGGATSTLRDQSPILTNCIFSGNSAGTDGGGFSTSHGYEKFTNCTFSENSASGDGGAYCSYLNWGTATFNSCILWGNTAGNEGPQIAITAADFTVTVNYCDVQGGRLDIYIESGNTLIYHDANNIESDPLFVDADGADDTAGTEDDNLRLTNGSPCIDAGDNTAVPADTADLDGDLNTAEPTPLDLNGFPRFIDDLCTVDTGNPGAPGPIVDMGAYEFLRSDIDSNGSVGFRDYCVIAERWPETSCGLCGGADLTCDGDVDWNDVRELVAHWLSKQ